MELEKHSRDLAIKKLFTQTQLAPIKFDNYKQFVGLIVNNVDHGGGLLYNNFDENQRWAWYIFSSINGSSTINKKL